MNTSPPPRLRSADADAVFACLADRTRRALLSSLRNRSGPVDVPELATVVTATVTDQALVDVERAERDPVHAALVHTHLPKLAAADLVDWHVDDDTAETADHPALDDDRIDEMLAVDAEECDAVFRALRSEPRRAALAALADAESGLDRERLAREVRARLSEAAPDESAASAPEDIDVELHHVHLPALQGAGLVVYDGETAEYADHPDLKREWLTVGSERTPDRAPTTDRNDVWAIEGRENVVSCGQSLFDEADEELFLMVTTDGLLEDECVRRLRGAVERGVDVYLGSQTPAVRDHVREQLPGVTIWEPQLDWLNLPPSYGRLGRLVFADREAVMLATLGEDGADGVPRETAITGQGHDNSLVVLLRQLLGSRLDHLDEQSADVRSRVPL